MVASSWLDSDSECTERSASSATTAGEEGSPGEESPVTDTIFCDVLTNHLLFMDSVDGFLAHAEQEGRHVEVGGERGTLV